MLCQFRSKAAVWGVVPAGTRERIVPSGDGVPGNSCAVLMLMAIPKDSEGSRRKRGDIASSTSPQASPLCQLGTSRVIAVVGRGGSGDGTAMDVDGAMLRCDGWLLLHPPLRNARGVGD